MTCSIWQTKGRTHGYLGSQSPWRKIPLSEFDTQEVTIAWINPSRKGPRYPKSNQHEKDKLLEHLRHPKDVQCASKSSAQQSLVPEERLAHEKTS